MINQETEGILCSSEHHNVPVRIIEVDNLGRQGCQGFVSPVTLKIGSRALRIQAKEFFPDPIYDDGNQGHVDPNLEARESYEALCTLKDLGFKVLPFFGLLRSCSGSVLVMSDLTEDKTKEIIDEKWLHSKTSLEFKINGEIENITAADAVKGLDNYNEVLCELLKTHMLQAAYDIHHGDFGTACPNMIIRDPITNTGEVFVSDVGEIYFGKSKYRDAVDFEELLELPQDEIEQVFKEISLSVNPETDIVDTFARPTNQKLEFQEIFYKSATGLACRDSIGGWYKDAEWSRKRFVRNQMSDHMMKTKLHLHDFVEAYKEYNGEDLLCSQLETSGLSLYDLAFLAVLDLRMQYIGAVRDAIDTDSEIPKLGDFRILIDEKKLPVMGFFDNYNERKENKHKVTLHYRDWPKSREIEIDIEMNWHDAYRKECGSMYRPVVLPDGIKSVRIGGKKADLKKSEIIVEILGRNEPKVGDHLYYGLVVNGEYLETIYGCSIESEEEIDLIKPFLAQG